MRIRANSAGRAVQVRWEEEAFECAVSAGAVASAHDEGAISRRFGAAGSCGAKPLLKRRAICPRPFGTAARAIHRRFDGVARRVRRSRAFTIVELLVVIAIIGLLAAVALPHLGGFGKSNSMTAATRQLLDDVAYARQKALLNRTTVYMVFVPPSFWSWGNPPNTPAFNSTMSAPNMTNLMAGQYTMYALLSLRSVGDQPGRAYPKYLTQWRRLPDGVTIANEKFYQQMLVTDTNSSRPPFLVYPFATTNGFPFPSIEASTKANTTFQLPYIAFLPNGSLTTNQDDYIPLTRASVFYPKDASGNYILTPPDWQETPPGASSNDYHVIHINWLTGRAKLERKEIQ